MKTAQSRHVCVRHGSQGERELDSMLAVTMACRQAHAAHLCHQLWTRMYRWGAECTARIGACPSWHGGTPSECTKQGSIIVRQSDEQVQGKSCVMPPLSLHAALAWRIDLALAGSDMTAPQKRPSEDDPSHNTSLARLPSQAWTRQYVQITAFQPVWMMRWSTHHQGHPSATFPRLRLQKSNLAARCEPPA